MGKPILWSGIITLGLVMIIGFYLRSGSWIGTTVQQPIQKDAADYFYYGYNLRFHHTYSKERSQSMESQYKPAPDAIRSPGYPIVLSFLIDGLPSRKLIKKIQLFQMLISTLTLVLAFFFFRCYLTPLMAGIAATFVAISPHLIMFNSYILTETLFAFILVLMGCLTCRYIKHPSSWFSVMLGSFIGFGSLIRPSLQFFPLVMVFWASFHFGLQKSLKSSFFIVLGFMLILSPWMIRNGFTIGKISDNSLMINFLHHGMYPDFKYQQKSASYARPYKFDPRTKEITKNVNSVLEEIRTRFKTDPLNHLKWYLLKKPALFWSWDTVQGFGDFYVYYVSKTPYFENKIFQGTHKIMQKLHGLLVIFGLLGSLAAWIYPRFSGLGKNAIYMARFVAALLIYYTLLHMIGAPFPRYSVPLRPFAYGMAMFFLHCLFMALKSRKVNSK
jgi:hypothetical protein